MARIYPVLDWSDGMTLTPHPLNAELNAIVGEMNGHLDRDNIPDRLLVTEHVNPDVFHGILWLTDTVTQAIPSGSEASAWVVPDGMFGTIVTGDGRLEVEAHVQWNATALTSTGVRAPLVRIRVDGRMVPSDVQRSFLEDNAAAVTANVPVGPGTHRVEVVVAPAASTDLDLLERQLWCRYAAR